MKIEDFIKNIDSKEEKPLDNIAFDGGFCGIFRTIGCVGDSLSSGEFETMDEDGKKHYYDMYEYSWGQYIARATGSTVYNFSRGGMTAREYMRSFADEKDFWNPKKACRAYIIALGVNDVLNGRQNIGTLSDICREDYTKNEPTFAGYYSMIIQRLKEIQPDAKFFFMTMPRESENPDNEHEKLKASHASLLYELAEYFENSYVIDLNKYAPVYDDNFKKKFFLHGHLNACGYLLTAKMVMSYIDYIIRHNAEDFSEIGLVGTPYKNFHQ
ncbi:MAG: SGNH/GDSL hydrolase family protein [Eubacteriales bacterium]